MIWECFLTQEHSSTPILKQQLSYGKRLQLNRPNHSESQFNSNQQLSSRIDRKRHFDLEFSVPPKKGKNDKKENKKKNRVRQTRKRCIFYETGKGGVPRVMIEHVTDLDVHGPIGPYEHVARGALDHGIHHLRWPTKTIRNPNEISDSPMTINRTTGAIGE